MANQPVVVGTAGGLSAGEEEPHSEYPPATGDCAPIRVDALRLGAGALPWLLVAALAAAILLQTNTPAMDIARYAVYWCLGVTLPGLLVARATLGTQGNWPEDVAIGAVSGLGLELVSFAVWSVLGLQQQLWLWPVLVVAPFVAVPRLRRHWRIRSPQPLPGLWSWGVASAIGAGMVLVRESAFNNPLPPAGGAYYADVTWHLSIVHELTRSFPPQIPQVAGEVLRYHWFSHIHLAAAHLISGAPVATVTLRLWVIPLLALTALTGARLARELSGVWWSGPVAACGLVVFEGTNLLPVPGDAGVIFPASPSQVYVLPLVLGVAALVVQELRGSRSSPGRVRRVAGWALLALLLVAASGAKPTALPLVLAGACAAGLSLLVQRRRQWLAALTIAAMVAVILPMSLLYAAGSDGHSTFGLFDFVEWIPFYHHLTGAGFPTSGAPMLPSGVSDLSSRSLVILTLLLLVPLVGNLARLAPFAVLSSSRFRRDPAAWFMAGAVVAGWGVYLVLTHPTYSEAYFLRLANPLATVFGAWALAAAVPCRERTRRQVAAVIVGGTLFGVGVVAFARAVTPSLSADRQSSLSAVVTSFATALVVAAALIAAGCVLWRLARGRRPGLRGWGACLALAALVLGGPAQSAFAALGEATVDVAVDRPVVPLVSDRPVAGGGGFRLTTSAGAAMAWVDQHTPNDAVIATNRHCVQGPERPGCLSLAFWVSGLGGRRTVLEGWGYTSASASKWAPTPFPARLAVNDGVFTHPSATVVDRLKRDYGASWLVADASAAPVSAQLSRFAAPRFSSGAVTVYELR